MPKGYKASMAAAIVPFWWCGLISVAFCALVGCSAAVPYQAPILSAHMPTVGTGRQIVYVAQRMVGSPYRYGGATPKGFDCSGLVQFAHRKAGVSVPRTTQSQLQEIHAVPIPELQPGDVVFFRLTGRKVSHVGIYAGGGRFIHAPSRGKRVSYASLEDSYWKKRVTATGRLY